MIPDDAWPKGDRVEWWDDETRTFHDFLNETSRPYTAEENAAADARCAAHQRTEKTESLLEQLRNGVAGIIAAREAAVADQAKAEALRTHAFAAKAATVAQRQAVTAFTPSATYSATQLGQVRTAVADVLARVEELQQALADFYTYRAAVNENAVTTDDALLWLARLVSGVIDD